MTVLHVMQSGVVELTEGSTDVRFDMPDGEEMHVSFHGTVDGRVMAAYAYLVANLPFLITEPVACKALVGKNCNVELL